MHFLLLMVEPDVLKMIHTNILQKVTRFTLKWRNGILGRQPTKDVRALHRPSVCLLIVSLARPRVVAAHLIFP